MAITTTAGVPSSFRAGDTTNFTKTYADYPASTWDLVFYFVREGYPTIQKTADKSGDDFTVSLSSAESAKFTPGRWEWFAKASRQSEGEITAGSGVVDILRNPASQPSTTFAEEALSMVEKSIRGDLPTAQESVSLTGVDITKMGISERFQLRDKIKSEIARERRRRRLAEGREYLGATQIRFT